MPDRPVLIGAAMGVSWLARYAAWLRDGHRDLELQDFSGHEVLDGDWRPLVDAARRGLEGWEGRLGIHGPFWGFSLASADPLVRDVVRRRLDRALDVCAALGARQMVVHSPVTAWDHRNLDARPGARDRQVEMCRATLADALARAEAQGVTLVLENIEDLDPGARAAIVQALCSPALRLSIDTGHAHYAHGTCGAPPVDYYVLRAGAWLAHMHLQDADGYADRHWQIGTGTIRWHAVFAALERTDATPHLVLELADAAGIPASMDWLVAQGLGR